MDVKTGNERAIPEGEDPGVVDEVGGMRWVGVTLALLGAIFSGVPVLIWLASVMPWQAGSAVAALGCIGFAIALWPREER